VAPQRNVINQGEINTVRDRCCGVVSDASTLRASKPPSAPIATSKRRRRAPCDAIAVQAAAAPETIAADHTLTGCLGSASVAAASNAALIVPAAATATSQSRRSRAEGRRTVQPRITQSRLNTRVPFVPPKPNEFFSAMPTFMSRAVLAQ